MKYLLPILFVLALVGMYFANDTKTLGATILFPTGGGTGSSTLTGIIKGNGTSPVQTAVPGTDYQAPITLTTTGSSGAATFIANVLNIPQYTGGSGGSGTVSTSTALTAGQVAVATGVDTIGSYASFLFDSAQARLTVTNASTSNLSVTGTATSTFAGPISLSLGNHIVAHGIQGDSSDGFHIDSSASGPVVALFGAGGSTGTTFYGGVNIDGQTRLATSLTGFLKGTSGVVSAVSSLVPGDMSLTKGYFLVGNDAGVAQATSSIFVSSTGNVGVGTTSPDAKLQVAGDIALGIPSQPAQALLGYDTSANAYTQLLYWNGADAYLGRSTPGGSVDNWYFRTGGTDRMTIDSTGKVGIGTTTPLSKLQVTTSGADAFSLDLLTGSSHDTGLRIGRGSGANGAGIQMVTAATDYLSFYVNGSALPAINTAAQMVLTEGGKVGIGSTTPYAKLSVKGAGTGTGVSFQTTNSNNVPLFTILDSGNLSVVQRAEGQIAVFKPHSDVVTASGESYISTGYSTPINIGNNYNSGSPYGFIEMNGGTRAIAITSAGRVGVGTTSPYAKLSVMNTLGGTTDLFVVASSTSGAATSTALIVNNRGFVGVGTAAPTVKFHVVGTASETLMQIGTNFSMRADGVLNWGASAAQGVMSWDTGKVWVGGTGGNDFELFAGGSVKMKILTTGNVGVGSTTPYAKLSVKGAGTTTGVNFQTTNSSDSPLFTILDSGNVGIGATLPLNKLDVVGTAVNSNTGITVSNFTPYGAGTGSPTARISFAHNSLVNPIEAGNMGYVEGGNENELTSTNGFLAFGTRRSNVITEAVRILSSGNVGIGTTSPSQKLTIAGGNLKMENQPALGSTYAILVGTYGTISETAGGLAYITGNAVKADLVSNNTVVKTAGDAGQFIGMRYDKGIYFSTNLTGSAGTTYTDSTNERMRIALDGNVGIGTTTPGTMLSIGSSTQYINLNNTATSTFGFGIKAPSIQLSSFMEAVNGIFTAILRIPYGASPTVATNGDIGIDSTSGQFKFFSGTAKVLGDGNFYPAFTYATSTAWAGTTTIPLGPAYVGETWNGVKCFTDTGTVNVSFYDGTNRMNMFNASTTVGTVTLSTNNTFTADEKRYVDIGTPASTPTKVSCTVSKSITAN